MIYLDTSAFVKLYLREEGSAEVHGLVVAQEEPLPMWHFMELESLNTLRFKVFLDEMRPDDVERLISLYLDRKRNGQYFAPHLDPVALHADSEHRVRGPRHSPRSASLRTRCCSSPLTSGRPLWPKPKAER